MTFRKRVKAKVKSSLRKMGLLCKKPVEVRKRIRVSKTVLPDGSIMEHKNITEVPMNPNSFESELHVWREIHRETIRKGKNQ
jgi:hypothetical protein